MINPTTIIGMVAAAVAVVSIVVARHRIPKQFRSFGTSLKISLTCLHGSHVKCDDHLVCPCGCHDAVIYSAIATRWEDALRPIVDRNGL